MEQAHAGIAGLGDLRGADGVVERGCLAAAQRIEGLLAETVIQKIGLHAVGRAEIEVPAVVLLEEACGAEILVFANGVHIGPEGLCLYRYIFTGQIGAALDDRWRTAEIEAEQGGSLCRCSEQPVQHLCSRPGLITLDETRCIVAGFAQRDGYALVPRSLGAGPVDGSEAGEGVTALVHRPAVAPCSHCPTRHG